MRSLDVVGGKETRDLTFCFSLSPACCSTCQYGHVKVKFPPDVLEFDFALIYVHISCFQLQKYRIFSKKKKTIRGSFSQYSF